MLRISHHKNVNKRENSLIPLKLESQKQGKKNTRLAGGFGTGRLQQALRKSHLSNYSLILLMYHIVIFHNNVYNFNEDCVKLEFIDLFF